MESHWYKDAVIYELDVRSFYDSDGDGVGDVPGIAEKLDYLRDLGITALVLAPSQPPPLRDDAQGPARNGSVYPGCGLMQELERVLPKAHARGIRVVTDLLVNGASDQALDVDHSRLRLAVLKVMRHWLDVGVDGLKLDGVPDLVERGGVGRRNLSEMHTILKEMREVIERHYPGRVLLAESNRSPDDVAAYFGDGGECHMAFNASLMPGLMTALNEENRRPIVQTLRRTPDIPASCQWALFLRNQNEVRLDLCAASERDAIYQTYAADPDRRLNGGISRRLAPLFENDRRRVELGYALLFSLPGSPVIYYGNEIGMGDNVYLGDGAGVRTPMQWSCDRNGGFSRADPARLSAPVNADPVYGYQALNVEAQRRQPFSLLNWMRRLIALRKLHPVFGRGSIELLEPRNHTVLAYVRRRGDDRILVVANLSGKAQSVDLMLSLYAGVQPVELLGGTSFRRIGAGAYSLALGPYGFYWFVLSRRAVRPARSNNVAAGVLSAGTDATEAPAAEAGVY